MNLGGLSFGLLRAYAHAAPTERGGFRLARLARRLVPRDRWNGVFNTGQGLRLDLDLSTYPDVAMAGGIYELDTDRLLRRFLRPGMHFIDGGANIGYFTARAARLVGKQGRVDGFEPDPQNRARLLANLQRNGLEAAVNLHPVALSDQEETITLHRPLTSGRNHGETSRYPAGDVPTKAFNVGAVRLDAALDRIPDLVKLDLEGSEPLALEGAARWLTSERPPAWIIEHNPAADARAGHRPGDLWHLLLRRQPAYRCRLVSRRLRPFENPEALDNFGRHVNVLFQVER